jgi:hypothetical protein
MWVGHSCPTPLTLAFAVAFDLAVDFVFAVDFDLDR